MLVLSAADVESVLDLDRLLDAVAAAMADLSAGRASMPNRVAADVEERQAFLGAMPAYLPSSDALTTKLVSVFPGNRDHPTHQAVIVCFDTRNGTPVALMDATFITAARTAAGSALSTKLLARGDARVLAVLGTGVQATAHLFAVPRVRSFERIVLAGRHPARAEALARSLDDDRSPPIEVVESFEHAVRGADVVCAATHALEPVVRGDWLSSGAHVTSVGFNPAGLGEVDLEAVAGSAVFVESRASALAPPPAGAVELIRPIAEGLIPRDHVRAEIGEVVAGTAPGRRSPDEITLYKSVGVAVQDAAAAALVLAEARSAGIGTEIRI
jgi:ornithine cyclodeaminase/alanine dehydrogenase-like protein (mu-crystallin family)